MRSNTEEARLQDALRFIPSDIDRERWVRIGMAIKSAVGDSGFPIFDDWSRKADNYNARDAKAVWKSIDPSGPVTAATVYYEAKTHGWRGVPSAVPSVPPPVDRAAEAARAAQARAANAAAAELAVALLERADKSPRDHPYYIKKDTAVGEPVQLDFGPGVRRGEWPQRGWDDALLVPLRDLSGKLTSVEAISPTGEKDFLLNGKKRGSFYAIGEIRDAKTIRITEGVANAAVLALDGTPTVAAMDAGNLVNVARAVRLLAPNAAIEIGADNDIRPNGKRNTGVEAATEAAKEVGGRVIVPELDGKKADFWDLWQARGSEAVAAAFVPTTTVAQRKDQAVATTPSNSDAEHAPAVFRTRASPAAPPASLGSRTPAEQAAAESHQRAMTDAIGEKFLHGTQHAKGGHPAPAGPGPHVARASSDTTGDSVTTPPRTKSQDVLDDIHRTQAKSAPAAAAPERKTKRAPAAASMNTIERDLAAERLAKLPSADDDVKQTIARKGAANTEPKSAPTSDELRADPREMQAAAERAAGVLPPERAKPKAQPDGPYLPPDIAKDYLRDGQKLYHRAAPATLAFVDKGEKLHTPSNDPQMATTLVRIAEERGWNALKATGTDSFKREVWLEATSRGVMVTGYKPTVKDQAELQHRAKTFEDRNIIEPTKAVAVAAATKFVDAKIDDSETKKAVMDKFRTAIAATPVADIKETQLKTQEGVIVAIGAAPWRFKKGEPPDNYYVKLKDRDGNEHMVWGKQLQPAAAEAKAGVGDYVRIARTGETPVEVLANKRDKQTQEIIGQEKIVADRHEFKIDVLERHIEQKTRVQSHSRSVHV